LIAGVVLAAWFRFAGFDPQWGRYWQPYAAAIGLVNLALPSLRYAFALRHIPASIGAVFNSTAPMFGALLAALFLGERFTGRRRRVAARAPPGSYWWCNPEPCGDTDPPGEG
jgi:drug/metabolite transporter (DMT)-like permease